MLLKITNRLPVIVAGDGSKPYGFMPKIRA